MADFTCLSPVQNVDIDGNIEIITFSAREMILPRSISMYSNGIFYFTLRVTPSAVKIKATAVKPFEFTNR